MPNDTTVNSNVINDLDHSFVIIQVTGLRQNNNLRRGFCTFKVSHNNMGETMRRINRMGGKIVDVTFASQYELQGKELQGKELQSKEVETNFVAPELEINYYVQPEKITQEDQENKVISTPIHTEKIELIETVKEENTEVETNIEVKTEVETPPEMEVKTEVKTHLKEESTEIKTSEEKGKKAPIHGHKKGWKSKRK